MAFFKSSKETKTEEKSVATEVAKKPTASKASPTDRNLESVILGPRVTEKSVRKGEQNVYTLVIRRDATKYDVIDAVKTLFGVTPVKVNIVNKTPRQFMSRGKGRTITDKGMKKAYVYLKQGEHIDLA